MRFSIIIPTLNEQQNIQSCLLALQKYRHDSELIVVDGGSHDATCSLAMPLADKVLQTTPGRALQMNYGAQQATGDWLIFLHADTFLPLSALTLIANPMNVNNTWGRFDIVLTGSHFLLSLVAKLMNLRSRLTGIATGDQAIFVKHSVFDQLGGYATMALMEDIELSHRLKKISKPLCLKEKVISSGRRWQTFGVLRTIIMMWSLRLGYFFAADPQLLADLYQRGKCWQPFATRQCV